MKSALYILLLGAFLTLGLNSAHAEKRVALVIGNSGYKHVTRLSNPKHDATELARKFREMGYQKVTLKLDLDTNALRTTLGQFSRDAAGADTAVIYFAGHGIEVDGVNYVIPTDAKLSHVDDVDFEAVELSKLMRSLNRAKQLKLVILDACRNNPFKNAMEGIGGSRSVGRGLARVSPAGSDTLVAYAAREGTVAADGEARHSPYAQALIKHIATPGLDVRLLFGRVRDDVLASTGRKQEPFTYGSLPGRRIFLAAASADDTRVTQSKVPSTSPQIDREALFWASVKDSDSQAMIRTYLNKYPNGQFAELAKVKLDVLAAKRKSKKVARLPEKITLSPKRKTRVQSPKSCEAGKRMNRFGYCEIMSGSTLAQEDQRKRVVNIPLQRGALTLAIQKHLSRVGCDPGGIDGVWGRNSVRALERFKRHANEWVSEVGPTPAVFELLARQAGRVCPPGCAKGQVLSNGKCVRKSCPSDKQLNRFGYCEIVSSQ